MTKIDIVSGFLGAGKTTLIKKLLADCFKGEKLVLVENEFGEIGVDGAFMKEAGIEVSEINSGCICCSLKGDFSKALAEVMQTYRPDRILIEPSGVGKLSDVIEAAKAGLGEDGVLNSFTAVADVTKAKMYMKNFGEFYNDQIASAHTVVLSRTQKTSEAKLGEVIALIKGINPDAVIITTPWDELDGQTLLRAIEEKSDMAQALMEDAKEALRHHSHHEHHHHEHECDDPDCACHHEHHHEHEDEHCHGHHHHDHECDDPGCSCHHHGHHADDIFVSWGLETAHRYTKEALESILASLEESDTYGVILRAKGVVAGEGAWYHFDLTPGEYEIREGAADYTGRICVIGSKLDGRALTHLFLPEA
jgi:G3E family GTPase